MTTTNPSAWGDDCDAFVRDITSVEYMSKSEVRRRLEGILHKVEQEATEEGMKKADAFCRISLDLNSATRNGVIKVHDTLLAKCPPKD